MLLHHVVSCKFEQIGLVEWVNIWCSESMTHCYYALQCHLAASRFGHTLPTFGKMHVKWLLLVGLPFHAAIRCATGTRVVLSLF